MKHLEYKVIIQKNEEGDGCWAYCPELPRCNSIGDTLIEVRENIKEAIAGYLETLAAMKLSIPRPQHDSVFLEMVSVAI